MAEGKPQVDVAHLQGQRTERKKHLQRVLAWTTRSSREVTRSWLLPDFSVVCFSSGTLPTKKRGEKGHLAAGGPKQMAEEQIPKDG